MKLVIQYVSQARVTVDERLAGSMTEGYVVLAGISTHDTPHTLEQMANKVLKTRIIPDKDGKLNQSIEDIQGQLLVVSQFTLYADTNHGNRPGFSKAAPTTQAKPLFDHFVSLLNQSGLNVQTGVFGAHMAVSLTNSGPITLILEN
jgi:D-aminoacyl-tRNA deacylase